MKAISFLKQYPAISNLIIILCGNSNWEMLLKCDDNIQCALLKLLEKFLITLISQIVVSKSSRIAALRFIRYL